MFYLIPLNIFWSAAAWVVDYPKLAEIPPWAWGFALVCPIYPLILALFWWRKLQGKSSGGLLGALAIYPPCVLGGLALAYYPAQMIYGGFNLNDLGQIFWVWFYAGQGWWLLFRQKVSPWAGVLVLVFLALKFFIDYKFLTFGYFDLSPLPQGVITFLFALALCLSAGAVLANQIKNHFGRQAKS